ncbi:MAG: radical SAM protein [Acidimicrobiia bacterium]|nr:radical SAM protein [Acidimicrobiia bacterium]
MFARAMHSPRHPILAQIIPTRRCNLDCAYCNEYDKTSEPVPVKTMLRRIDLVATLGTTIITLSGGEPTLHPQLDAVIARIRSHGAIATLITNGLLLTPEYIRGLNRAGLDYLQISIDNVRPDKVSKKSLQVLDLKLQWLAEHAEFDVTINSVLGCGVRDPEDAYRVAVRARELGFPSTVGVLHDHNGQLRPLEASHRAVYDRIVSLGNGLFSFAHYDRFQEAILDGRPNQWHCRAGGRFLYICEDGLVHFCSQQRGSPAIPLEQYTPEHLARYADQPKPCAPLCTISCVHQTAMLDAFREQPRQTLAGILERRRLRDPAFETPPLVRMLDWMFLNPGRRSLFGKLAVRLFGVTR